MTEGEKIIWAATYAAEWSRQLKRKEDTGIEMYIPGCVEHAWAAVEEARDSIKEMEEGWGADSEQVSMLKEMVT